MFEFLSSSFFIEGQAMPSRNCQYGCLLRVYMLHFPPICFDVAVGFIQSSSVFIVASSHVVVSLCFSVYSKDVANVPENISEGKTKEVRENLF